MNDGFDLTGTIDLHVHTGPDVFPRIGDDLAMAKGMANAGMVGMAVKCAFQGTEIRAHLVNQQLDGFTMYGGIALNYGVGGINPAAVETSLRVGGRVVWGPSGHSRHHGEVTGSIGGWGNSFMNLPVPRGATGVTVLDADGNLSEDAREVIRLVGEHGALLATSHLGPTEVLLVIDEAVRIGTRVVVNHVLYIPSGDLDFVREVVRRGADVEICSILIGGFWNKLTFEDVMQVIDAVGYERIVLASDAGGIQVPSPEESLRVLANNLVHAEVPEAHVRHMLTANPSRLLGLSDQPSPVAKVATHV
jgi:hypothetical protein